VVVQTTESLDALKVDAAAEGSSAPAVSAAT